MTLLLSFRHVSFYSSKLFGVEELQPSPTVVVDRSAKERLVDEK